jgi:E3 ubiquitin-protein ligase Mdm2
MERVCTFYNLLIDEEDLDEGRSIASHKIQGSENSSSYQYVKRQRRRTSERSRSISVTVTTFDYSSSGDETIYSAQGYETVAVGDMEELISDEDTDTGYLDEEAKENIRAQALAAAADAVAEEDAIPAETPESNESSDNVFEIEDVYQVEYEPESEIDTEIDEQDIKTGKKKRSGNRSSDSDSDLEDVIVVSYLTSALFEVTDLAEWADSSDTEVSDSGIETPGATSKDQNPSIPQDLRASNDELVEHTTNPIKCISCNQPDAYLHPLMKECHSCWQKRRGNMPERPKPRRRKNKGKGKNSNRQGSKHNVPSLQKSNSLPSTSREYKNPIQVTSYTSDQTSSSHTTDVSSQEMVMDDEVESYNMVKRPSLNRSFSENYETRSKKTIQIGSVSVQSDGEEHKNVTTNRFIDNLKAKAKSFSLDSIESTTGSTGSIDSQKSCDSGFISAGLGKHSLREHHASFDEASEAIDTEDDSTITNFTKDKKSISNLQNEGETFPNRKRNVLGENKYSSYNTDNVTQHPGEKGCEPNTINKSKEFSANAGNLCNICNERPKDACFVHQKISHQFCCYKCAKKQFKINRSCPVCRRKVEKITRNILA